MVEMMEQLEEKDTAITLGQRMRKFMNTLTESQRAEFLIIEFELISGVVDEYEGRAPDTLDNLAYQERYLQS